MMNLAGTHLNLTAILTTLHKHNQAIDHAKKAIELMDKLINEKDKQKKVQFEKKKKKDKKIQKANKDDQNMYLTQAIAHYNLGASYEHLNKMQDALSAYQTALNIA